MDKKAKFLIWLAIIILTIVFCGSAIGDFVMDREISSDPVIVEAKIVDIQSSTRRRKGRTSTSYDFVYAFEANGKQFQGEFGTSESNAGPYLDAEFVQVMYNAQNPEKNDLSKNVDTDKTIVDLLLGFLLSIFFSVILGFIIGIVLSYKLGWLSKKKKAKEQGDPASLDGTAVQETPAETITTDQDIAKRSPAVPAS